MNMGSSLKPDFALLKQVVQDLKEIKKEQIRQVKLNNLYIWEHRPAVSLERTAFFGSSKEVFFARNAMALLKTSVLPESLELVQKKEQVVETTCGVT